MPIKASHDVVTIATRDDAAVTFGRDLSTGEIVQCVRDYKAAALIIRGKQVFDAATIAFLPESVRIIASATAGFDHIDLQAARNRASQ